MATLLILGVLAKSAIAHKAHSFQHYHGPVEGEGVEVVWKDKHGHEHVDYKAHPKYEFAYGVEDHHTKDFHGQKEHRDGNDERTYKHIILIKIQELLDSNSLTHDKLIYHFIIPFRQGCCR